MDLREAYGESHPRGGLKTVLFTLLGIINLLESFGQTL